MGCGASSGQLVPSDILDHQRSVEAAEGRRLPVAAIEPSRSALRELLQPTQCSGAAGALDAKAPRPRRVLLSDPPIPHEPPLEWHEVARSGWARSTARALRRQHQPEAREAPEGGHALAAADVLREQEALKDQLFWGTTKLKELPLTWRMAVAQLQRLRRLSGLGAGLQLFDHDCCAAGVDYAQWRCDMVDTDQEPPLEEDPEEDDDSPRPPPSLAANGSDLGMAVDGGRSPWDVLQALLASPLGRRGLPLWAGTESFGVGFAQSAHTNRTHVCGVFPQRPALSPQPAMDPAEHSRRFVCYPPDSDSMAPRACGYQCAARPASQASSSGLIISVVFTRPDDIMGFLRMEAEWLDVTDPPPTRPNSGTPVEFWQVNPRTPTAEVGSAPLVDQVLLGAHEILPPGRSYRVSLILELDSGTEKVVWNFKTGVGVTYRVVAPPRVKGEVVLDEEQGLDAGEHEEGGAELSKKEVIGETKYERYEE